MRLRFVVSTPHEEYESQLRDVGLHTTALGSDWIAAAARALTAPVDVDVPHREARFLDPERAVALAYRIPLERGQRLVARIEPPDSGGPSLLIFLDLFFVPDSFTTPQLVASSAPAAWELEYVALRPGSYLLRLQPELLRGGRVTLTVSAHASLGFPVAGRNMEAIRSRFGAPRDAGRREHHGVDIFAPRGTPVVAAAAGRVSRVTTNRLGGNVVWIRESEHGRRLYYAHLDRHAVLEDAWVEPGDTLGFVGNTGNARTTPPHLHFGIYQRGQGPVDPYFHLLDPARRPPALAGDVGLVGQWARVARVGARARTQPARTASVLAELPGDAPVEVLAVTSRWYLARLPDGQEGYLAILDARPVEPARFADVAAAAVLRPSPDTLSAGMDSIPGGQTVSVLGRYGDFALIRAPDGLQGWVKAATLAAGRPTVAAIN